MLLTFGNLVHARFVPVSRLVGIDPVRYGGGIAAHRTDGNPASPPATLLVRG